MAPCLSGRCRPVRIAPRARGVEENRNRDRRCPKRRQLGRLRHQRGALGTRARVARGTKGLGAPPKRRRLSDPTSESGRYLLVFVASSGQGTTAPPDARHPRPLLGRGARQGRGGAQRAATIRRTRPREPPTAPARRTATERSWRAQLSSSSALPPSTRPWLGASALKHRSVPPRWAVAASGGPKSWLWRSVPPWRPEPLSATFTPTTKRSS